MSPIPCSLWCDVYEEDRTTIAWTVTTEPGASNPYLIDPMRYGEQQLDVAKGSASIGTVTVGVIDPAQTPGDQDTGWMTERLAQVFGRRCRLRRFIDPTYIVIADGPAGEPRLEPDYASYTWEIRDTRETERKLRAFEDTDATTSVWPSGVIAAFGSIPAVTPNVGSIRAFFPPNRRLDFGDYWATGSAPPNANGTTVVEPEVVVTPDVEALFIPTVTQPGGGLFQYTYHGLTIRWRETGSADPYTVVKDPYFLWTGAIPAEDVPLFLVRDGTLADGRSVRAVWRSALLTHEDDEWSAPFWSLPIDTDIDLIITRYGAPSRTAPIHVSGITAGEFAQNAYDGLYSPRDSEGAVVPTGVLYDETALLEMDTPVSIRLFEPIKDIRDELEKYLYTPTGWCPALDDQGRISPVSQQWPADDTGLEVVDNPITEPRSSWGAGKRVINVLRFTYPRDYVPDATIEVEKTGDGMARRSVVIEFRDEASVTKHGEQVLEIDGRWFAATGDAGGQPIDEDITDEIGYQLAQLRNTYAKGRYENGAPTFSVAITRVGAPTVRAGSYVAVDLSWLPNPFETGLRGLTGIGQVLGLANLDCAWRDVTIEMTPPPPQAPQAIDDLDATTFSHARIDLMWTLPEGATGVKLHRSTSSGFTPGGGNLIATVGAVESYNDSTGLSPETTYFYKAIAFNVVGDAPVSNQASDTTDAEPTPPDLLTATRTELEDADICMANAWSHRIAWTTDNPDDTNYQINIYVATNEAGDNWELLVSDLTTDDSQYDDLTGVSGNLTGMDDETTFWRRYRVSLAPAGGGAAVEELDTSQGEVTLYSDPCT